MKTLSAVLALIVTISWSPLALAQQATPQARALADTFFDKLKKSGAEAAYDQFFEGTRMKSEKAADLRILANQTGASMAFFGPMIDHHFVDEEQYSPHFVRQRYIVRMQDGPIFYTLFFYEGPAGWRGHTVNFGDQPSIIFE